MIPPFGEATNHGFGDELLAEAVARIAARQQRDELERCAMRPEQLMKLESPNQGRTKQRQYRTAS